MRRRLEVWRVPEQLQEHHHHWMVGHGQPGESSGGKGAVARDTFNNLSPMGSREDSGDQRGSRQVYLQELKWTGKGLGKFILKVL